MAPVNMAESAYKHGFQPEEALFVMTHSVGARLVEKTRRGEVWAYVGYPYEGSDRKVELLVERIPPRTIEVFHFMDLSDHWRSLWTEES